MTAVELTGQVESFEQIRSKVKLTRNAKGDAQWEITVVVGDDVDALNEARRVAVAQWRELESDLGVGRAAA
ncbi:MAG: hypothetical protein KJ058_00585 [Thermoanaerobaculia bacterium]|nr:hypothetical protein [Thermoanaerobaculia bacterium]